MGCTIQDVPMSVVKRLPRVFLFAQIVCMVLDLGAAAFASDYDLCARGVGDTFTRTTRVILSIEGPPLAELSIKASTELIRRLVWKERAARVFVEPYDEALCDAALGATQKLRVSLTSDDISELDLELNRGPADPSPRLNAVAQAATVDLTEPLAEGPAKQKLFTLNVYYATNRQAEAELDPYKRYANSLSTTVSYGKVPVTIPKDHRMGELETASIFKFELHDDPDKHFTLQPVVVLDLKSWKDEVTLRATKLGAPGVLLFVHGYNVSFAQAAIRTAQLAYDLAFPGPAMFFSWPSQAEIAAYRTDEQLAANSVEGLGKVLSCLGELSSDVPIYVIAHSMGNRILAPAFGELLKTDFLKRHAFKEIVLTAPDIDADTFKNQIAPNILGHGPRFTLYASSNDKALSVSRTIHSGEKRLGESSPYPTVMSYMDTVDASNVRTDFLGHSYYGDSTTVMSDLFYLLRKRLGPDERFGLEVVSSANGTYWKFRK